MKKTLLAISLAVLAAAASAQVETNASAITYQGFLQDSSAPADGTFCFEFQVYDAETAGAAVSPVLQPCNVAVDKGRFSVDLDFGPDVFNGQLRWLEIKVVSGGNTITLSPRQKINPAPTALYAQKAGEATTATVATSAENGVPAGFSMYSPVYPPPAGYTFSGNVLTLGTPSWSTAGTFTDTIGLSPIVGIVNNKVYVAALSKTYEYDLVTKAIATKKGPLSPRSMSGGAMVGNKLYQVGGYVSPAASDIVTVYDPSKDSWAHLAKLPAARVSPAVASAEGKLYAFGGYTGPASGNQSNMAYRYDPVSDTWATIAAMPYNVAGIAVTMGNQIHVIGMGLQASKAHLVYNIPTNSWSVLPPPTPDLEGAVCVALGQRIHLVGGFKLAGGATIPQYLKTHSVYDVSTQTWTSGLDSLRARQGGGVASIDPGHFIYVGGNDLSQPDDRAIDIYNAGDSILYLHTRQ